MFAACGGEPIEIMIPDIAVHEVLVEPRPELPTCLGYDAGSSNVAP